MNDLAKDYDAILITGPTASGKSALALRLAREAGGVVVNADSMQVYDTLQVLTARPSPIEMEDIPHHLYGHVPADRAYSTGEWLRDAGDLLSKLRVEGRMPVVVGGTGLYFKALTGGLSDMPKISQNIRDRLRLRLKEEGAQALYGELSLRDPDLAGQLRPMDGQRVVRALEVLEETGRSIAHFQNAAGPVIVDPDRARKMVVLPERAGLHERVNPRFATILARGV